jgi:hypothetical protein
VAADTSPQLSGLTVDWLTRWLRQQLQLYPVQFTETFGTDDLTVEKTLTVVDQVEFKAYGDWRFVGSQGQPAFAASWIDYGAPYQSAAFTKTADGVVLLHGVIKSGTVGSAAFVLPPGYRPEALISLPTVSNGAFGRVDIATDGSVTPQSPSSNLSVSLDGLWFMAR